MFYLLEKTTDKSDARFKYAAGLLVVLLLFAVVFLSAFTASAAEGEQRFGWVETDGKWSYYNASGTACKNGIYLIDNKEYLFDEDGVLRVGFYHLDNKLYYFDEKGDSPQSGLGEFKKSYKGWKKINSNVYYFNGDHSAAVGWKKISKKIYYFSFYGKMKTGWSNINNRTFYFKAKGKTGESGKLLTGWRKISGKNFYFKKGGKTGVKGYLLTGVQKIGKNKYCFETSGKNGTKGKVLTGWRKINGYNYYFAHSGKKGVKGRLEKNKIVGTKKTGYGYVDKSGKMITTKAINLAVDFVLKHTYRKQSKSVKLRRCYDYLWKHYTYKRFYGLPNKNTLSDDYACYILQKGYGNCFCYGAAYACIARVIGYDSRVGVGEISAARGGMTPHGWAEVKRGNTWYIVDPDMKKNHRNIGVYMRTMGNYPYALVAHKHYRLAFENARAIWIKTR